mgnify:FL=1
MPKKITVGTLNSAGSISAIERLYQTNPEIFELGAEYDPGMSPNELKRATSKWAKLLENNTFQALTFK